MALARSKTANVGTAEWLQTERQHADDKIREEVEEFGYAVKNELEWLNAHLGEVFSQSQVYASSYTSQACSPLTLAQKLHRHLQDAGEITWQDSANPTQTKCLVGETAAHRCLRRECPCPCIGVQDHLLR